MMLKYLIQDFRLSLFQNYGSLTHETRIKDAVNMEDLICLLATVRTLKLMIWFSIHCIITDSQSPIFHVSFVPI